jgi:hypothetical protein
MAQEQDMKRTRKEHNAGFKAKVALAEIKNGRLPSWRISLGFIRTRLQLEEAATGRPRDA